MALNICKDCGSEFEINEKEYKIKQWNYRLCHVCNFLNSLDRTEPDIEDDEYGYFD